MVTLPSPEVLASLVSNVTETMLGITFQPELDAHHSSLKLWRTAVLPIPGADPLTVGLSSDEKGCNTLSAAMFSCKAESVDAGMAEDALRELVNMTAGLVKSTLGLNQPLGLPTIFSGSQTTLATTSPSGAALVLRARDLGIVLWVQSGLIDKA
jgi:hypothetical protein